MPGRGTGVGRFATKTIHDAPKPTPWHPRFSGEIWTERARDSFSMYANKLDTRPSPGVRSGKENLRSSFLKNNLFKYLMSSALSGKYAVATRVCF